MTKAEYNQLIDVLIDRDKKTKDKNRQKVYNNLFYLLTFAEKKGFLKDMSKDAYIRIITHADKVMSVVDFWIKKYNSHNIRDKKHALEFYNDMNLMAQGHTAYILTKHKKLKDEKMITYKMPKKPAVLNGLSQKAIDEYILYVNRFNLPEYGISSKERKARIQKLNLATKIKDAYWKYQHKLTDYFYFKSAQKESYSEKNTQRIKNSSNFVKSKGDTMAKSTAKKTTSKSTAKKARAKKTYTYTQVRALIKRALRGRKTIRKAGRGKSYNTRYAGRVEKGVYTYTLKNR